MESYTPEIRPDRLIPRWLIPIRAVVRAVRYAKLKIRLRSKFLVGRGFVIGKQAELRPPQYFIAGDNVYIGPWFLTETNLKIGNDVLISSRVSCIGNDHAFDDPQKSIITQGRMKPNTVIIEGDNLLGFGTIVVGDVRIGKGCIVGAGSVVIKDLPPYHICAGVPAKPIRKRY